MALKRRAGRRQLWISMILLAGCVFVLTVLWQVLPHGERVERESLTDLKERLAKEKTRRRLELEEELAEWQMKNEKLKREIRRLRTESN